MLNLDHTILEEFLELGFDKKSEAAAFLKQYGYDYTTDLLKENGYDGIVYTHPKSSGRKAGTKEYIVFDAESIRI